jgi:hypothetical protein
MLDLLVAIIGNLTLALLLGRAATVISETTDEMRADADVAVAANDNGTDETGWPASATLKSEVL